MSTFILYLLKCILCSGLLFGYYRIAFYNRKHHQWNRFYLLISILVSLLLPLITVPVRVHALAQTAEINLLSVVPGEYAEAEVNNIYSSSILLSWSDILTMIYLIISFGICIPIVVSLLKLFHLYRSSPHQHIDGVCIVDTSEQSAPFSFLRTIFWNNRIDIHSDAGCRIYRHELEHARQLHSVDRLFVSIAIALCWCNPFLWLMRKELIVVHEFIADEAAIADGNSHSFSEMILLSLYPSKPFGITSSFFYSPIKRRLTMLTGLNQKSGNRLAKWLLLPIGIVLFTGFSIRKKQHTGDKFANEFILVLDAGHGGERLGVTATDGTKEKDVNLAIANKIREMNRNDKIKIILTREADTDVPLRERVQHARNAGANAFISVHVDNAPSAESGMTMYISKRNNDYVAQAQVLGTFMHEELSKVTSINGQIHKGADKNVFVLDAPEVNYPSLLIEFGNMNNESDREYLKANANLEKIATQVLNAVSKFAEAGEKK